MDKKNLHNGANYQGGRGFYKSGGAVKFTERKLKLEKEEELN